MAGMHPFVNMKQDARVQTAVYLDPLERATGSCRLVGVFRRQEQRQVEPRVCIWVGYDKNTIPFMLFVAPAIRHANVPTFRWTSARRTRVE